MKTGLITITVLALYIGVSATMIHLQQKQIDNLSYQDQVNKIEIKYLKNITADRAEKKQEEKEELVSLVKVRSIFP